MMTDIGRQLGHRKTTEEDSPWASPRRTPAHRCRTRRCWGPAGRRRPWRTTSSSPRTTWSWRTAPRPPCPRTGRARGCPASWRRHRNGKASTTTHWMDQLLCVSTPGLQLLTLSLTVYLVSVTERNPHNWNRTGFIIILVQQSFITSKAIGRNSLHCEGLRRTCSRKSSKTSHSIITSHLNRFFRAPLVYTEEVQKKKNRLTVMWQITQASFIRRDFSASSSEIKSFRQSACTLSSLLL